MSPLIIHISRTAGACPGDKSMRDWALGSGCLTDALDTDAAPIDALVLMHEPALPGVNLATQPAAILHLRIDGVPHDEVLLAPCSDTAEQILEGVRTDGVSGGLVEAVRRLHPGHSCAILGGDDAATARYALNEAFFRYVRMTGALPS